jgi:AraC-like DNA-binding protein
MPAGSPHLASNLHWSRLKVSLLWIYRGTVPAEINGFMTAFPTLTAWLVLKGAASVISTGRSQSARAGEWLFPRPGPRHQRFSPGAAILSVRFRIEWPNGDQLFDEGLGAVLRAADHPDLERRARRLERAAEAVARRRYRDASFTDQKIDFLQFLQIEKAVHSWSESVYRALLAHGLTPNLQQTDDPRMESVLEELDRWPLEEPYRVEILARKTGLSRSTLERLAMKTLGAGTKAYIERRRLDHALQGLRPPALPVKQIAFETGFRHASSFCAWFKGRTGNYPGEMAGRIF